jgi:hypothetical protein
LGPRRNVTNLTRTGIPFGSDFSIARGLLDSELTAPFAFGPPMGPLVASDRCPKNVQRIVDDFWALGTIRELHETLFSGKHRGSPRTSFSDAAKAL